jgi:putative Mn2+ efflux pump MntP
LPASSRELGSGGVRSDDYVAIGEFGGDEVVSVRQALVLGVALALNNAVAGVGAGVAGISPLATTLLAGGLSLLCVGGGSCGGTPARWRRLGVADLGLMLLALGAMILAGAG